VKPVLIRQHEEMTPPGLLADWLRERGIPFEIQPSWDGSAPDPTDYSFVASLGSPYGPNDTHEPSVVAELELIEDAVNKEVPVLGLCFGGEALSAVLGGRVERAPVPELGWREIETDDPDTVPAGPWLEWHYERFTTPPGAVELARTADAVQAFRYGPHLGVQFHPESTVEIVAQWAGMDTERLAELGVEDGAGLLAASDERQEAARAAAFRLFDAFAAGVEDHRKGAGDAGGKGAGMIEQERDVERPPELSDETVTSVRVIYPDLHGVVRGKDVPIGEFDRAMDHGLAFCSSVMGTDLRHTPVVGSEEGYPDLIARPDLSTMTMVPWEPGLACCIADLHPVGEHPPPADPRGAVRRVVAAYEEIGLSPVVGPELEFFLCEKDPEAPNGMRRYVDNLSMVYTVGPQADPRGVVREIAEALSGLGMGTFAANHEFMNSQYEINLHHADALTAADRAFRLKGAVKDVAAIHGLVATFMGKPFNDQGGSGFHFHFSLSRDGKNAFADDSDADGVSEEMRHFMAGMLAHARALTAFLNPTVNAYRRLVPDSLAPTHANWGWDNRTSFIRVPPERGGATRAEVRVGDGSANPYLATAATLFAGLHGVREKLPLEPPVGGDAYTLSEDRAGGALPATLEEALNALEADDVLREAMGAEIVDTFLAMKRFEAERHRTWVSDWEITEYLHHL
jgi:glutamine synthetase